MELRKTFQFEAAHLLPRLPKSHKCRRLHGHSFKVEIVVDGDLDKKLGWVMDYADISEAFKPIWERPGSSLLERDTRFGKPHEREYFDLDLE
jgi:6-pyruvoyltetrahydropterin/6-carboxytetrahydropterin synthase